MKIASLNANGIRARLPIILDWIATHAPEVLCLQETKVQNADFPAAAFEQRGYTCTFDGQKSYNGVAILSKAPPTAVRIGFGDGDPAAEPRLIMATIGEVSIVNTYVPQGQDPASEKFRYKLAWLARLHGYFEEFFRPQDPLVWVGDLNVAPEPIDVYDPEKLRGGIGFHPEEHQALAQVMQWGFQDIYRRHNPHEKAYTFWDYRIPNAFKRGLGWRIDHICATRCMAERSQRAWIDTRPRGLERPSDHTFVVAEFVP